MIDSFSHIPSPNSFKNDSSLNLKVSKVNDRNKTKSNNFGTEMFILFLLRKRIPTLDIFIHKIKEI